MEQKIPTGTSVANRPVQDRHKLRDDMVYFIESSENSNDIRAWIGVPFAQHASQKDSQSLWVR